MMLKQNKLTQTLDIILITLIVLSVNCPK